MEDKNIVTDDTAYQKREKQFIWSNCIENLSIGFIVLGKNIGKSKIAKMRMCFSGLRHAFILLG